LLSLGPYKAAHRKRPARRARGLTACYTGGMEKSKMKTIAVKIWYDNRTRLKPKFKYSAPPTSKEYEEKSTQHLEKGKGGWGFHESMNFRAGIDGNTLFYLPPGYVPGKIEETYNIVWVTYEHDPILPSHIIGIHKNVSILAKNRDGIPRSDYKSDLDFNLGYHGYCKNEDAVLLPKPIKLRFGRHIKEFQKWGNGLRYIDKMYYKNIIKDVGTFEIDNIVPEFGSEENGWSSPDKVIGREGEEIVYNNEIEIVSSLGGQSDMVEWLSNRVANSVVDIKSRRKINGKLETVYIEVKTTRDANQPNIFISSRQVAFLKKYSEKSHIVVVDYGKKSHKYYTPKTFFELNDLSPIEFRVIPKKK
jgi:hypothetical protein